jgi:hypothetical protein
MFAGRYIRFGLRLQASTNVEGHTKEYTFGVFDVCFDGREVVEGRGELAS